MSLLPTPSFWSDKRVLITGHTGLKGAWLWLILRVLGARPAGIALAPSTYPNLSELTGIVAEESSALCDVRDFERMLRSVREFEPEVVFHLAAQSLVGRSYVQPTETFSINLMGTTNILEAVRLAGTARAIVVVTSDKVYRDRTTARGFAEGDMLGGRDCYSISKACVELAVEAWRGLPFSQASRDCGIATARAGNVIGGGDWCDDRLIPDLIRALTTGGTLALRNPESIRSWIHVLDVLTGYLILAERLVAEPQKFSEAWNFGPSDDGVRPVMDIIAHSRLLWNEPLEWKLADAGAVWPETQALRLDSSKAAGQLGWRTRLSFKDTLFWTFRWYQGWHTGCEPLQLCLSDIESYFS
jgi:CDP-glucose 4,6-dehydratase